MRFVLLLLLWIGLTTHVVAQQARPIHVVRAGETLFAISRQYSVSVEDIKKWNNMTGNTISTGQRLFVGPPAGQSATSTQIQHRVAPGETLTSISRRYGVTIPELTEWNRLTSTTVETGQMLMIRRSVQNVQEPAPAAATTTEGDSSRAIAEAAAPSAYYVVKRGDALGKIAEQYGITLAEIRELNKLQRDAISPGQILLIRKPESLPAVGSESARTGPQGRFVRYVWKQNDVLSSVLSRSKMTQDEFSALNPDIDIRNLRAGNDVVLLLPPAMTYANPYRASRPDPTSLGSFSAGVYTDGDIGKRLTSGDLYLHERLSAGHNTIPLGTVVYVEHPQRSDGIFVVINDRILEAEIRLSKTAFEALGLRVGQAQSVRVFNQQP
jgi:LysM repeat protein